MPEPIEPIRVPSIWNVTQQEAGGYCPFSVQNSRTPAAKIAVRDDLVRRAKLAGWTFTPERPAAEGRMTAHEFVGNREARLGIAFASQEPGTVVLLLPYGK